MNKESLIEDINTRLDKIHKICREIEKLMLMLEWSECYGPNPKGDEDERSVNKARTARTTSPSKEG